MMMNTVQDPSFRLSALYYQRKSLFKSPILTDISIAWIIDKLAILWIQLMSRRKCVNCSPNAVIECVLDSIVEGVAIKCQVRTPVTKDIYLV